ncbi:MAG: ATP-binding cassette domain-containing protein [Gemmatimonadetes bacterium]|nr:ATP-binding cassette domain-containing protein [Gemmatimonadota bacterium]
MNAALEVQHATKSFGDRAAVDDVSFEVRPGEIFGFLGPNGSGKTTTMRMALNILRPDSGRFLLLGEAPSREVMRLVGYLPEERGLPVKARVGDVLRYLGRLKGLDHATADRRVGEALDRIGLLECRDLKVQALSRGMSQLVQFASALLHEPELIILDEPFAGLDPLNVRLMKEIIRERQARGAAVVFSTHIMSDVEELCERVVLIDQGRVLVYGPLMEMKRSRGARSVRVAARRAPERIGNVRAGVGRDGSYEYLLGEGATPEGVLRSFLDARIEVERFEVALPSLNEIFIEEVRRARDRR